LNGCTSQRENPQAKDMVEIARMTGVSRARVSQVMDLMLLAPIIQTAILNDAASNSHGNLRFASRISEWKMQRDLIA